jgi:hypothetical protein
MPIFSYKFTKLLIAINQSFMEYSKLILTVLETEMEPIDRSIKLISKYGAVFEHCTAIYFPHRETKAVQYDLDATFIKYFSKPRSVADLKKFNGSLVGAFFTKDVYYECIELRPHFENMVNELVLARANFYDTYKQAFFDSMYKEMHARFKSVCLSEAVQDANLQWAFYKLFDVQVHFNAEAFYAQMKTLVVGELEKYEARMLQEKQTPK